MLGGSDNNEELRTLQEIEAGVILLPGELKRRRQEKVIDDLIEKHHEVLNQLPDD